MDSENKELKRSLEQTREENQQFKIDNKEIWQEIRQIKEELKSKNTRLVLGQVAYNLEAEIWKFVLPNEKMDNTRIFLSMKEWLNKHSKSREGEEAQNRWENLQVELGWNEQRHQSGLRQLKYLRTEDVHPTVDLQEARKELREGGYIKGAENKNRQSCQYIVW